MDMFLSTRRSGNKIFLWNVETLVAAAKDLPVEYHPVSDFNLEELYFFASYDDANVQSFVEHMARVESADLDIPVILGQDGVILDGLHRLAKASRSGISELAVVQFLVDPEPLRVIELPESHTA
jgi:hypothetical protein